MFERARFIGGVELTSSENLIRSIRTARPEAIINCAGIVKQRKEAEDPIVCLEVNSLLPHRVAEIAQVAGCRFIHISTDCVFSGKEGNYREDSHSDALDLYGRTKFLGEVGSEHSTTIRTSIIGRELETSSGLVEWFLSAGDSVRGFTNAIFSGLTTKELARVIDIVLRRASLSGLWQVSSSPISKFDLLFLLKDQFGRAVHIEEDPSVHINRVLDSSRFRSATGYAPPSWVQMVGELASDRHMYEQWRSRRVT